MNISLQCVDAYKETKNLKMAGEALGIPWQTVYVHLRKEGFPVVGDKARYGSQKDRLARNMEIRFGESVPFACDSNDLKFQSNIDFLIRSELGANIGIDVKAATADVKGHVVGKKGAPKWGFCISKQKDFADFFVLYALIDGDVRHVFVIPSEVATTKTTISIPVSLQSKWADYEVNESDLTEFFSGIRAVWS